MPYTKHDEWNAVISIFLKRQQIKTDYIGNARGRNLLGAKPTSDEFCHKIGRKLWFFLICCDKNPEKINYCYSSITQLIKRKWQYIVIKILLNSI